MIADALLPPPLMSPLLASMGIRDRWMLERIQHAAPLLLAIGLEPVTRARIDREAAQQARVARIARTVVIGADVLVDLDASDPDRPNRKIRRSRRADPLDTLKKHRSITKRHRDAAEALRSDIENGLPSLSGGSQSEIHTAPWDRCAVSDEQVQACGMVRRALDRVAHADRLVLTWMVGGGTITGFARFARVRHGSAVLCLKRALDVVADFYLLGG